MKFIWWIATLYLESLLNPKAKNSLPDLSITLVWNSRHNNVSYITQHCVALQIKTQIECCSTSKQILTATLPACLERVPSLCCFEINNVDGIQIMLHHSSTSRKTFVWEVYNGTFINIRCCLSVHDIIILFTRSCSRHAPEILSPWTKTAGVLSD